MPGNRLSGQSMECFACRKPFWELNCLQVHIIHCAVAKEQEREEYRHRDWEDRSRSQDKGGSRYPRMRYQRGQCDQYCSRKADLERYRKRFHPGNTDEQHTIRKPTAPKSVAAKRRPSSVSATNSKGKRPAAAGSAEQAVTALSKSIVGTEIRVVDPGNGNDLGSDPDVSLTAGREFLLVGLPVSLISASSPRRPETVSISPRRRLSFDAGSAERRGDERGNANKSAGDTEIDITTETIVRRDIGVQCTMLRVKTHQREETTTRTRVVDGDKDEHACRNVGPTGECRIG